MLFTAIVRFSLRYRGLIIALAFLFIGYGLYSFSRAKYDVFPEFAPPQVVIATVAPGLSAEQVEILVTQPIENAVSGVPGIESVRSGSIQGISAITVTFYPGSDIYRDRQVMAEALAGLIGRLPKGVEPPEISPLTSSTNIVLILGLTSERRSLMELRTVADWTMKQSLLAVPGVSKVVVFGGEVRQFQVQVDPDRLIQHHLALEDIAAAAGRATGVRGAGYVETENQRVVLQSEGQSLTAADLAKAVLLHQPGANLRLGDVARVVQAPAPAEGDAEVMGQPGVLLMVSSQFGANTLEVTEKVEQALNELRPMLDKEGIVLHPDIFRPANFIETSLRNVRSSLEIGAVLVVVVLLLFLFNLRTAAISCTAIPLSLLAAIAVLANSGQSLNTMTLGGLAIAIGQVVDNAVIDVENILRRLRENQRLGQPRSAFTVVLDATVEVQAVVVYATLGLVLVFIPVLTMSGLAGRLFTPLGLTYVYAILASLVVAVTVTPALCLVLLGNRELKDQDTFLVRWLKARYRELLEEVNRHPRGVIGGVAFLLVVGLALLPFFGGGFLPEFTEGHFVVHMNLAPGAALPQSIALGTRVARELLKLPTVRTVSQWAGRAARSDDIVGTQFNEFDVDLKPIQSKAEFQAALSDLRRVFARFPGASFDTKTFLTERIEETFSGFTASVVINIFGQDLDLLDAKAQEVARVLGTVPGATEVLIQSPPGTPQLAVRLRPGALSLWGFDALEVLDAVNTAYQGEVVGQVYDGNQVVDVSVILDPKVRQSVPAVGSLPLKNAAGTYVRLRQLADIFESSGRYVILHDGARRVQAITCNVAGRDLNSFTADAKKKILAGVSFPAGTYLSFTGAAAGQARSRQDLLVHALIAGVGLVLLLSIVIGHWHNLVLVLVNLPFALVGGVLAVFVSGGWLSIGSMVGFVTLFGITLANSIMLISHFEHLVVKEGQTWGPETAIRGALERMSPILMTALVTALGLMPLAIGSGAPGREIEGPMALVILGGLLTSTLLNLLVLPVLALRFGKFQAPAPQD